MGAGICPIFSDSGTLYGGGPFSVTWAPFMGGAAELL